MKRNDNDQIDPELESDLGAEFDLRGDQLQQELEAAKEDAARHLEAAQRVQAEFENFRKRTLREMEEARQRAGQRLIEGLLPVVDNLERAIDHTVAGGDLEHFLKGVELVHQQVSDVFGKEGVEVLDPLGGPFDPNLHQAVGQREDAEVPDGTVVEVFQKGYSLAGRVLRPAMVIVSTGGPSRKE